MLGTWLTSSCPLLPITLEPTDERAAVRRLRPKDGSSPGCTGPIQEARVGFQRLAVINAGSIQTIAEREAGKNGRAGTYGKLPNQRTIHA